MSNLIPDDALRACLPEAVARRAAVWAEGGSVAREHHVRCAVLFADLSGFTALTERLAEHGPAGAETLSAIIGDIFGPPRHRGVQAPRRRAAIPRGRCHLRLGGIRGPRPRGRRGACRGRGNRHPAGDAERAPLADEKLTARVAVAEGPARIAFVGGADGRFEALADGDAIARCPALRLGPGRLVAIDPDAAPLLGDAVLGPPGDVPRTVARSPVPPPGEAPRSDVAPALLAPFVPRGVRMRLEAKQSGWVAEFRA